MAFEHYPQLKAPLGEIQANATNWYFLVLFCGSYFFPFQELYFVKYKPISFAKILMAKRNKCEYSYSLYGVQTVYRHIWIISLDWNLFNMADKQAVFPTLIVLGQSEL